ncbi:MAG: acetyl esterase [Bradymonadia bacterium]|jgi:acetyl esterase
MHPKSDPAKHGVRVLKDVPYRNTGLSAHTLDVYVPEGAENAPVVLYIHGGGFRILSKETHWAMALAFAARGYVTFSINYRLAPGDPFPAAAEDACAAYRWVCENAEQFGGDSHNIVLAGESAGANLVCATTVAATYERPEPWAAAVFEMGRVPTAILPAAGMLEVSNSHRFSERRALPQFIQDRIGEVASGYLKDSPPEVSKDLANPLVILETMQPDRPLPPAFASVGTADPLLDDTRRFAAAYQARGGECEVRYYPGEVHAFHAFLWRKAAQECWQDHYKFLDERVRS